MLSFQIGRIEGRWRNFLPPIQGGKFRSHDEDQGEELPSDTSSDASTRSTSSDADGNCVLRRRMSVSTDASSAPSIENLRESKPLFLDARTQQEIDLDTAKYPSLDEGIQTDIVNKYRELNERIIAENLYDCNYSAYLFECCRYTLLASLTYTFLRIGWYGTSAFFLGCFWHQLVFTAHDAGHMGITHHFHVDTVIGIIIADFLGGLSIGWWKRNHNVHHIVTNAPEHDPDIEHMPFFAISHRFFSSLRSSYYDRIMTLDGAAKFFLKFQNYLYYPIMLFGRFNLYRLSWEYILLGQAPRRGPAWWHV